MRCAVFATEDDLRRTRVTRWLDWDAAQDEWTRLDDLRRAGGFTRERFGDRLPAVRFFEVRSQDDPKYNELQYEPWVALTDDEKPQWVKLDKTERQAMVELGRKQYGLDDAHDAVFSRLMDDPRWYHLEAVDVSDYAQGVARFCFPSEAKYR